MRKVTPLRNRGGGVGLGSCCVKHSVWPLNDESGAWDSSWNSSPSVLRQREKVKREGCSTSWGHVARPSEFWEWDRKNRPMLHGARFTGPSVEHQSPFWRGNSIVRTIQTPSQCLITKKNIYWIKSDTAPKLCIFLQSSCHQSKKKKKITVPLWRSVFTKIHSTTLSLCVDDN